MGKRHSSGESRVSSSVVSTLGHNASASDHLTPDPWGVDDTITFKLLGSSPSATRSPKLSSREPVAAAATLAGRLAGKMQGQRPMTPVEPVRPSTGRGDANGSLGVHTCRKQTGRTIEPSSGQANGSTRVNEDSSGREGELEMNSRNREAEETGSEQVPQSRASLAGDDEQLSPLARMRQEMDSTSFDGCHRAWDCCNSTPEQAKVAQESAPSIAPESPPTNTVIHTMQAGQVAADDGNTMPVTLENSNSNRSSVNDPKHKAINVTRGSSPSSTDANANARGAAKVESQDRPPTLLDRNSQMNVRLNKTDKNGRTHQKPKEAHSVPQKKGRSSVQGALPTTQRDGAC